MNTQHENSKFHQLFGQTFTRDEISTLRAIVYMHFMEQIDDCDFEDVWSGISEREECLMDSYATGFESMRYDR